MPTKADWLSGPDTFVTEIEPELLETLESVDVFWEVVVFVVVDVVGEVVWGTDPDSLDVHESILTLNEYDSFNPVYPFIAEISTFYSLKESSSGVPPILIPISALPFTALGWFSTA